jgi:hypothetical protein
MTSTNPNLISSPEICRSSAPKSSNIRALLVSRDTGASTVLFCHSTSNPNIRMKHFVKPMKDPSPFAGKWNTASRNCDHPNAMVVFFSF